MTGSLSLDEEGSYLENTEMCGMGMMNGSWYECPVCQYNERAIYIHVHIVHKNTL